MVDNVGHLLSLKVMRVSRPGVVSTWQPFFSSSPHFSAHASASVLSLQGYSPLPAHPKTLRDLTHASDLLTLPSSFGSIQLGQTFSSCLCVNNEAPFSVDSIRVCVEMQTATTKASLYQTPESSGTSLTTGDTLECIVGHEIKELGQHVLACTVTYRLPPNVRPISGASGDPDDPGLLTFRRFYKFIVTNPLAVKTKVRSVRSPTALLMPTEREKIFLEVHIQNVTQETMHFEQLSFEPTDEWQVQDPNVMDDKQSVFSGSIALMNPQDVRQYIFILFPTSTSSQRPLAVHAPGTIYPLGRLNIMWRSSYGEPGRLLTSTLTRRIPLVNPAPPASTTTHLPQHPASALPLHLKRDRTTSPQSLGSQSRPGTPPLRSPAAPLAPTAQGAESVSLSINAHLTLREPLPSHVRVEEPITLAFTLHINSTPQIPTSPSRPLLFAIQHVLPTPPSINVPKTAAPRQPVVITSAAQNQRLDSGYNAPRTAPILPTQQTQLPQSLVSRSTAAQISASAETDVTSPRTSLSTSTSGFSTPTAVSGRGSTSNAPGTFNYVLARQKLLVASPWQQNSDFDFDMEHEEAVGATGLLGEEDIVIYPPPYPLHHTITSNASASGSFVPIGASSFTLPPLTPTMQLIPAHPSSTAASAIHASQSSTSTTSSIDSGSIQELDYRQPYASYDLELSYIPLRTGFHGVGGVRVLYLGEADEIATTTEGEQGRSEGLDIKLVGKKVSRERRKAVVLKEYDIVAELLVSS